MGRDFWEMHVAMQAAGRCVCVGLDTDEAKIPESARSRGVARFNDDIVEAVTPTAGYLKPNLAFYEKRGGQGWNELRSCIMRAKEIAPHTPIIGDGKRGDIGNTNDGYTVAFYDWLGVDAITLNPYLGQEALRPFLNRKDKGNFILVRTSNPGAGEFQDLYWNVSADHPIAQKTRKDSVSLFEQVAHNVATTWNTNNNCGGVAGATYPAELERIRAIVGDMPLLIPGIGAQGGDLEATVKAGRGSKHPQMIINSSRGIIFASTGPDYAEAARRETEKLHNSIIQILGTA